MAGDQPYRQGASDVAALMFGIFCVAVFLLFFSRVAEYEPLRRAGLTVEGRWVDGFIEPRTTHFQALFRYQVGEQSFRGRQNIAAEAYGGDGTPVTVIYLPEDPKLSRVLGGEAIKPGDAAGISLSLAGILFAVQHIYAYYRQRSSWAIVLRRQLRRFI